MFTGIVEEMGQVESFAPTAAGARLRICCRTVLEGVELGDSIAVNGCCLTVVELGSDWWVADLSDETLERTTFGSITGGVVTGDPVNLERAVTLADRLGGHMVQGHVDGIGEIVEAAPDLRVSIPRPLLRYTVEKGSITVDGVSLTIVTTLDDGFTVAVIPHTAAVTTLGVRRPGAPVNIEVDVMAKYVERLVSAELDARSPSQETSA